MVALASAFVRIRPAADKSEFRKTGEQMGTEAGKGAGEKFGGEYTRGADGRLRDHRGKFVKDSEAMGKSAGSTAGRGFSSSFGSGTSKAFDSLKANAKLAAGVFIPIGLGAAVAQIGKIGIAYEDNLNIFKSVSKATGQDMDTVAAKARALGADVQLPGVSAAGAAEAMTELAKAGFTVQQSMDAARATLQLSRIANISEGEAAEIAANAVNAFGIKASDTGKVVDELAAAANSSSIEVTEASASFKQAAAAFAGIQGPAAGSQESITELNTAIAILGNNGIKGSDAGTSLKQMLLQLTAPSNQAKGIMIELAAAAGGVSVSLDQQDAILHGGTKVRDTAINQLYKMNPQMEKLGDIAYDSSGKMRPLRDILDLVAKGTKDMTQEERNFAISQVFGADATRSVLALLKGGVPVYDAQRKAILEQGAAAKFAAAKNAGLGGAIDNVKSQFENASIAIYNAVKGPLTTGLNSIATQLPVIFGYVGDFSRFVSQNIGTIRDWAVAIGTVTLALKINSAMLAVTAAGGLIEFVKGISIVTKATGAWAAVQTYLNATLIANPIGAIIIAIAALVAGVILLYKHNETFRNIVQAVWGAIKTAIGATVDWITGTAWPAIKAAWDAIAAAAMWLWHNVIQPVWNGIQAAINFVVSAIKLYIQALIAEWNVLSAAAMWLWHTIFEPVFNAIKKIVEIWWLSVQVAFAALVKVIQVTIGPVISWLGGVFSSIFGWISDKVSLWWQGMKIIFDLFRQYVIGPVVAALQAAYGFFARIFGAIASVVSGWWNAHVAPIIAAFKAGWTELSNRLAIVYTTKIKPMFDAFVSFIKDKVVGGFSTGVALIGAAWDKVKEIARKPVAFVVNQVINPFIRGLNKAAGVVGVKDRVSEIAGFRQGGRISGTGGITDNRQAAIPGVGAVQLQGGEFVVNRNDTARALPLLQWVNAGMKGGAGQIARYLGRPVAREPGDGSEGFAFRKGGLIGWADDVWDAVTHPVDAIKKPFESLLNQIPGSGMIRDFLVGASKRLLNGAVGFLGKISGGGNVGKSVSFLRSQAGKPYGWAQAGPSAYDCSGIVSAVWNIMHNKSPYNHTFSTSNASSFFPKPGQNGPMAAAWSHPGQSPASASVGHMMGRVGNINFESTGSGGVRVGKGTRSLSDFANIGHYRDGGMFGKPIKVFDNGGFWPSGTLGANLSGRTEYVDPNRSGTAGGVTVIVQAGAFSGAVIASEKQAEDMVVKAFGSAVRSRRITAATIKAKPA